MKQFDELDRPWPTPRPPAAPKKWIVAALLVISLVMLFSGVAFIDESSPGAFGPILSMFVWIAAAGATVLGGVIAGLSAVVGGRGGGTGVFPLFVAWIVFILNSPALLFLVFGTDA